MWKCCRALAVALLLVPTLASGQEYALVPLKEAAPDDIAAELKSKLAEEGFKVLAGKRTLVEIWPAKELALKPDFKASDTVFSPVQPGALVGALRFGRKGVDFRGQDIAGGTYTLRYAYQPVDGNHVGTFATRDFLVMVPAADDQTPEVIADEKQLNSASAKAAESSHPAIMPLVKPGAGAAPELVHHEELEWWTLRFEGQAAGGRKVPLEVIVVGKSAE